jgi:glycosyltransferase involved in cell wall biosynthesis
MHPRQGGPPRVAVGHALQLKHRGHEPEVLSIVLPGDEPEVRRAWRELEEARVPLHLSPGVAPLAIGRSPKFNAFIDRHLRAFDAMHIHGTWEHCLAYAGKAAHRAGVPYVLTPHGMLDRWSRARSALKKAVASRVLGTRTMMRWADGAQFGTPEERDEAADLGMAWRPFILPHGIVAQRFVRSPGEGIAPLYDEFPRLRGRSPLLLFYSRMHPKKGVDLLLDAMGRLAGEHPDVGLLVAAIAQDGSYEARMRERADREDLRERVAITTSYTGKRGIIPINASEVFVLPSHQEGFSMAIVEAMAYGLAMVITDRCHMGLVSEVGAGEVVPATVDGIAQGLDRVIRAGPRGRAEMGAQGREWVLAHCAWERIGEKLESMYEELIRAKQGEAVA